MNPIKKRIRFTVLALGIISPLIAISSLVLSRSLPYRINPEQYARYLCADMLSIAAIVIAAVTILLSIIFGQRSSAVLGVLSLIVLFLFMGGVHSGPNPQGWCYGNLRQIDGAKEQFERENHLTNGVSVTPDQIAKSIEGGFGRLKCTKGGIYTIGAVGVEPRCSIHGSITEIEKEWSRRNGASVPSQN